MDETPKSKDGEKDVMLAARMRLQPSMLAPLSASVEASATTERLALRKASLPVVCVGEFIVVWADSSEAWRH